jgi:hypothetical protein
MEYYWSVHQSEWATDILSVSGGVGVDLPSLVRGLLVFSRCRRDAVLGKKPHGSFQER